MTASFIAKCDGCGHRRNVKLSEKTDPRTFKPIRKRLCGPCRHVSGFAVVNFERPTAYSFGQQAR